jgi:ADP-heptose:LPS heptosyltransferase
MLREAGMDPAAPFIAVAPGASAAARRYAPERYARVIDQLSACDHPLIGRPLPVVLLGSVRETELADSIIGASQGRATSLVGRSSLLELAALVERSALLIGNNSGPMHFADAFRRPVVALYSGTEYESQWQPRHAPVRLLRRATDCSPCHAFRCPLEGAAHMACLDIEPEEVVAAAIALLHESVLV